MVGIPALQREDYVSDLKVVAKTDCRALRITRCVSLKFFLLDVC